MADSALATADAVRAEVRGFIDTSFDPKIPLREWLARLADSGWACPTWPTEWFGKGLSNDLAAVAFEEFRKVHAPGPPAGLSRMLAAPTIIAHGNDEQKRRFIRPILVGDEAWCQLFSEPGAGSDLAGLKTKAVLDGDSWVVNGQKVWSSSAQYADWGILLARTNPDVPKHRGITYFLVDMRTPGIDVRPLRQITGHAHFNEVFLDDVRIPADQIVGVVDGGWGPTHTTLANERTLIGGAGAQTTPEMLIDLARRTGQDQDPVIRQGLAEFFTRVQLLKYMNYRVQTAMSQGRMPGPEAATTKLFISQHQTLTGELLLSMLGAGGMLDKSDALDGGKWQLAFLNQFSVKIGGGTDNIQRNALGERVLGLPAEPRTDKNVPFKDLAAGTSG